MEQDCYYTLAKDAVALTVEKKSKFFSRAAPVESQGDADAFAAQSASLYRGANHHVVAYRLRQDNRNHASDDREPPGTAGMPVLKVLEEANVLDAVIVVSRFFGGTLLGTGGLVRAYTESAKAAVEAAGIILMERMLRFEAKLDYAVYDRFLALLNQWEGSVLTADFREAVHLEYRIPPTFQDLQQSAVRELLRGDFPLRLLCEEYADRTNTSKSSSDE